MSKLAAVVLRLFWDAAAVWEAFTWDHRDDETPPAGTADSLKLLWVTTVHSDDCNSRQEHYADRARGTKATVAVRWGFFFQLHQVQSAGQLRPWPPWNSHPACSRCTVSILKHHLIGLIWSILRTPIKTDSGIIGRLRSVADRSVHL